MNPIFTLSIDLEKRKISATGLVAVGEKVDVVVKGVDYSSIPVWETDNTEGFIGPALRFRLVTPEGKDLVRFPLAKGDAWNKDGDSLSAEVDFNTMQLRDWLRGFPIAEKAEVGIIIDSVVDAMEYGRGTVKILQWVASPAEDPTILPDWRKTLRELNAAIVEISYKSEQAVDAATLAESAKELARKYADSASIAANNALKSENEAKRFRNESLTAAQSASESANDASGARTAAESAKVAAETARDEAREHAESAKVELQAEVERATMAEKKNAAAIDETGKALVVETERAKAAEQNLANEVSKVGGKINTIIADDAGKSARTIAAEEVAKVVADAPADFDTLKEIAEYIESDKTGAAQMVTKIDDNANAIAAEAQRAQEAEAALRGTVDGKADKVANATAGNLATLDENGNLADSGKAIGDFALAASLAPAVVPYHAYEVGDLCTSFDNDENHRGTWLYKCILATDGYHPTWPDIDPTHWALATVEDVLAALRGTVDGKVDKEEGKGLSTNDYTTEDKEKLGTAYTPDNPPPAPDLSGYATKSEIPYSLIEVTLADRINLTDRAVNKVTADGSLNHIQFVFPEKKAGKSRDFFLRHIITGETVPTLSFSEPNGDSVSFDADYDSWADIEQGVNILMFTDTEE